MDHSIMGYLNRRTTEELDLSLHFCLEEENLDSYGYMIPMILKILREREKDLEYFLPQDIAEEMAHLWEHQN